MFQTKKNVKITKREHVFKDFPSTFNVEIISSSKTLDYNLKILNMQFKVS